jgi:hypothetical protein
MKKNKSQNKNNACKAKLNKQEKNNTKTSNNED